VQRVEKNFFMALETLVSLDIYIYAISIFPMRNLFPFSNNLPQDKVNLLRENNNFFLNFKPFYWKLDQMHPRNIM